MRVIPASATTRPAGQSPASSGGISAPPDVWSSTHTLPEPHVAHVPASPSVVSDVDAELEVVEPDVVLVEVAGGWLSRLLEYAPQ